MYEQGFGVTQDFESAAKWFQIAASAGYIHGQYAIGRLFEEGAGVPKSITDARLWFMLVVRHPAKDPDSQAVKVSASQRLANLPRPKEESVEFDGGRFLFVESSQGRCVIALQGRISNDAAFQFDKVVKKAAEVGCKDPLLLLESPGGDLRTGIALGREVHFSGFRTIVRDYCASACSLIFLGGKQRILAGSRARIGLHQSATTDRWGIRSCYSSRFDESSREIRRYLRLVLPEHSERVFDRSIATPCNEILWIRGDEAVSSGIATRVD
jgi:ATP-dependent protease ClpP protease subunit